MHEREWLEAHFLDHIFPVLTPIAVDPAHPFPFIPNFGFTLGLELRARRLAQGHARAACRSRRSSIASFVCRARREAKEPIRFIRLETVVGIFVSRLFPGYRVQEPGRVPGAARQ